MFPISWKHDGHGVLGLWGSDFPWCDADEWHLTHVRISARWTKWGSVSKVFGLTRTSVKCCFSTITQGLTPASRIRKPSHNLLDGVIASTLQPLLRTFRFSSLQAPERCCPWKEVLARWWCGQCHQNLVESIGQGLVLFGHTSPHSMLAQSYRTAWRVLRKLQYINQRSINIMHWFRDSWINIWWNKMWGITFWAPLV